MNPDEEAEIRGLLSDIVFWGDRISAHIESLSEREFSSDQRTCDAVCWCITCMGEAAGKLLQRYPHLRESGAELSLANAYAMRNRIAHGYFSIDLGIVWRAATESVPSMVSAARRELRSLE